MKNSEIAELLRTVSVETGSLTCLGCGYERSCGVHGCAIMNMAADALGNSERHVEALQKEIEGLRMQLDLRRCALCDYWLGEADSRCMCGKSSWGGKTVPKDNYCSHWERHKDWIPVTERLPEYNVSVLGTDVCAENKYVGILTREKDQDDDADCWIDSSGWWNAFDEITHWMPLPMPPEVERL